MAYVYTIWSGALTPDPPAGVASTMTARGPFGKTLGRINGFVAGNGRCDPARIALMEGQ